MKENSTQQEILLVTGTSFSRRQYFSTADNNKQAPLSEQEQLEQACWNGLLKEMLPEVFKEEESADDLFLWDIKKGSSFIEIELGEYPQEKERYCSIDPYAFLPAQFLN